MVNNQNEPSFTYDHAFGYVQKAVGTSHVSGCDVFDTSGEDLRLDNFKDNGKRFPCDVSPDNAGRKRAKQIDNMDSFQGTPPSDEVACSGCYDLPWTNLSSPVWVPTFPSDCDYQSVTRRGKVEEICTPVCEPSSVHEDLSHKPVAIGPNHQALIPDWNPSSVNDNDGDSEKWIRYCVSPSHDLDPVLSRNICCDCADEGSMRCVRQHVAEVREDIRRVYGQEKFENLGFCNIGEEVALNWTAEEEKLFQEAVSSNPKSMDKNFWDDLSYIFPNKSSRDVVSYYFNVFILRKRAQQNRWDPAHIDSDDDEWQEPESMPQVCEQEEEEEDQEQEEDEQENESAIESLTDGDDFVCSNVYVREDSSEQLEEDEYCERAIAGENKEEEPCFEFGILEEDGNTDSCTSFDEGFQCVDANNGFGIVSNDGAFDDLKNWDIDFGNRNEIDDFLSACNVVDEVIGMEVWDNYDISGDGFF
ncbi:ELM2 domain-containing protein [Rhynchospora pubera]|uniref:ELM2 domain-containing protein n=1 Tax=Rhynchospora pubera TaxID=906938 RepID=A0AAV8HGP1_9POAL|nr:ELM2 domain-containing protein [Rhynchospora pubera]